MKSPGKFIHLFGFGLAMVFGHFVKAQKLWSEVSLNKTSVYVGEPAQVTVKVYTSTWFTEGVDPGNVKVNGAFTVYFRSVSASKIVDGKTFPGVEMIFNVFPFDDENVTFPSLDIQVVSPKENDYKGMPHTLKTKERLIAVKPIPPGFDANQWLVTSGMTVNDQWIGNIKNVKVGDVLERRISRDASNTVSELIPPIAWDSLQNVSLYPARSSVENHKSKTAISATRTESMRYLFEKDGEVTLPEMVFVWWNPYQQKVYKRTLPVVKIDVKANPDLGMLASIKDSLAVQVAQSQASEEAEDKPVTILGMTIKQFVALVIMSILVILALYRLIRFAIKHLKHRKQQYRESEAYFFHEFVKASRSKNRKEILQTLYRWIDELKLNEPSLHSFTKKYGTNEIITDIEKLDNNAIQRVDLDLKQWRNARDRYVREMNYRKPEIEADWINPTDFAVHKSQDR